MKANYQIYLPYQFHWRAQSVDWNAQLSYKKMKTMFLSNMSKSRRLTLTFFPINSDCAFLRTSIREIESERIRLRMTKSENERVRLRVTIVQDLRKRTRRIWKQAWKFVYGVRFLSWTRLDGVQVGFFSVPHLKTRFFQKKNFEVALTPN